MILLVRDESFTSRWGDLLHLGDGRGSRTLKMGVMGFRIGKIGKFYEI